MSAIRLVGGTNLIALLLILPSWSAEPPREPRSTKAHVDLYGDPLPEGAIARLGTVRFRHPGAVFAAAFSPDGKLIAASSNGRPMVIIWDRSTGKKLREIPVASRVAPPQLLRFSANGKRLYGSLRFGRDMRTFAWDVGRGAAAKDIPPLPSGFRALGFSPDVREAILRNEQDEVVRWDIEKGKERGRYPQPEQYWYAVAVVGDRLLLPRCGGSSVSMWEAGGKAPLWSVKASRDKNYPGPPMAFSADGKLFAVEALPQVISLYESISGKLVRQFKANGDKLYYSLAISPDGRTLASSGWLGSLRLWDLHSGRERVEIAPLRGGATTVFFAPDSKVFATGAQAVLLWDTASGQQVDPFSAAHVMRVCSVSFSPDGKTVATTSQGRQVLLWEARTGRLLRTFESLDFGPLSAVAFSPDGATLAVCDWIGDLRAKKVRILDARTGRQRHAMAGHEMGCTSVVFSPDGKRLASGDAYYNHMGEWGGRLCIWDVDSGKRLREIRGTRGAIHRVLFSSDGRRILAAADRVHIYDADTGQLVVPPFPEKRGNWSLALSADDRLLATSDSSNDSKVRLWELATRREIPLALRGADGVFVDLTPDGRTLAASSRNGAVVLLHWPSGETVGKLGNEADIGNEFFFSPDGRLLATANNHESTALIWDVASMVNRSLPAVPKPSAEELRRWWEALRNDSPAEAYKAVWRFAAVPEQTLPFLAASLQPAKPADAAAIARLIDDLDSDQFQVREKASQELSRLGEVVVGALRKAKSSGPSLEQRMRIERLLAELTGPVPGPEQLRAIRAVAVLEQIGGAEARKILTRLAAGVTGARLTEESQAALGRLKRAER